MEAQKETIADCSEKETSQLLKVNFDIAKPSGKLCYTPRVQGRSWSSLPEGRVAGVGESIVGPAQPARHQP
eukprot:2199236-Rhodomonas_salina.1